MALAPSWLQANFNSLVAPSIVENVVALNALCLETKKPSNLEGSVKLPSTLRTVGGGRGAEICRGKMQNLPKSGHGCLTLSLDLDYGVNILYASNNWQNCFYLVNGIWIWYEDNNLISWEPKSSYLRGERGSKSSKQREGKSKGGRFWISIFDPLQLSSNAI